MKIFLQDDEFLTLSEKIKDTPQEIREKFDIKNIVYEDGDILVINKEP